MKKSLCAFMVLSCFVLDSEGMQDQNSTGDVVGSVGGEALLADVKKNGVNAEGVIEGDGGNNNNSTDNVEEVRDEDVSASGMDASSKKHIIERKKNSQEAKANDNDDLGGEEDIADQKKYAKYKKKYREACDSLFRVTSSIGAWQSQVSELQSKVDELTDAVKKKKKKIRDLKRASDPQDKSDLNQLVAELEAKSNELNALTEQLREAQDQLAASGEKEAKYQISDALYQSMTTIDTEGPFLKSFYDVGSDEDRISDHFKRINLINCRDLVDSSRPQNDADFYCGANEIDFVGNDRDVDLRGNSAVLRLVPANRMGKDLIVSTPEMVSYLSGFDDLGVSANEDGELLFDYDEKGGIEPHHGFILTNLLEIFHFDDNGNLLLNEKEDISEQTQAFLTLPTQIKEGEDADTIPFLQNRTKEFVKNVVTLLQATRKGIDADVLKFALRCLALSDSALEGKSLNQSLSAQDMVQIINKKYGIDDNKEFAAWLDKGVLDYLTRMFSRMVKGLDIAKVDTLVVEPLSLPFLSLSKRDGQSQPFPYFTRDEIQQALATAFLHSHYIKTVKFEGLSQDEADNFNQVYEKLKKEISSPIVLSGDSWKAPNKVQKDPMGPHDTARDKDQKGENNKKNNIPVDAKLKPNKGNSVIRAAKRIGSGVTGFLGKFSGLSSKALEVVDALQAEGSDDGNSPEQGPKVKGNLKRGQNLSEKRGGQNEEAGSGSVNKTTTQSSRFPKFFSRSEGKVEPEAYFKELGKTLKIDVITSRYVSGNMYRYIITLDGLDAKSTDLETIFEQIKGFAESKKNAQLIVSLTGIENGANLQNCVKNFIKNSANFSKKNVRIILNVSGNSIDGKQLPSGGNVKLFSKASADDALYAQGKSGYPDLFMLDNVSFQDSLIVVY